MESADCKRNQHLSLLLQDAGEWTVEDRSRFLLFLKRTLLTLESSYGVDPLHHKNTYFAFNVEREQRDFLQQAAQYFARCIEMIEEHTQPQKINDALRHLYHFAGCFPFVDCHWDINKMQYSPMDTLSIADIGVLQNKYPMIPELTELLNRCSESITAAIKCDTTRGDQVQTNHLRQAGYYLSRIIGSALEHSPPDVYEKPASFLQGKIGVSLTLLANEDPEFLQSALDEMNALFPSAELVSSLQAETRSPSAAVESLLTSEEIELAKTRIALVCYSVLASIFAVFTPAYWRKKNGDKS